MPDFNAKMHQNRFRLGLRPRPRWGSLQGKGREGRGVGNGGEGGEEGEMKGKGLVPPPT